MYAREPGSVAAPTAGLHFTPELLARLAERGVKRAEVLLHVGAGTFKPVEVEDPAEHLMHEEWCECPRSSRRGVNATRAPRWPRVGGRHDERAHAGERGRRRRAACAPAAARRASSSGRRTRFRAVDPLVTNFHLPRSTLLMLVAAFAGYDLTMRAYREAIAERYRFYSYGDAMAIV